MGKETVSARVVQKSAEEIVQLVLDILDQEDGRSFLEKKELINAALSQRGEEAKVCPSESQPSLNKEAFWDAGGAVHGDRGLLLRPVSEADREGFLLIKQACEPIRSLLHSEALRDMLWREHTEETELVFSIEETGVYVGYCGIEDLSRRPPEISIELLPQKTGQGIGYAALRAMLDALHSRLGLSRYRVRIEPTNSASQRLFEKLGAAPNGISEYLLHDPAAIAQLEQENSHLIDDALIRVADKFSVPPEKLLSHVLEYVLTWPPAT